MVKHCHNCKFLDYYEGNEYEGEGPNGYSCTKKNYKTHSEERRHLLCLEREAYRLKPKKCFEALESK